MCVLHFQKCRNNGPNWGVCFTFSRAGTSVTFPATLVSQQQKGKILVVIGGTESRKSKVWPRHYICCFYGVHIAPFSNKRKHFQPWTKACETHHWKYTKQWWSRAKGEMNIVFMSDATNRPSPFAHEGGLSFALFHDSSHSPSPLCKRELHSSTIHILWALPSLL